MTTAHKIIIVLIAIVIASGIIYYASEKYMAQKLENEPATQNTNEVFNIYLNNTPTSNTANQAITNNNTTSSQENVKVEGTNEQKALALAQNMWGASDNTVHYQIAKQEGNIYYVSVIRTDTTEVLAWYKVNVENGEVSGY